MAGIFIRLIWVEAKGTNMFIVWYRIDWYSYFVCWVANRAGRRRKRFAGGEPFFSNSGCLGWFLAKWIEGIDSWEAVDHIWSCWGRGVAGNSSSGESKGVAAANCRLAPRLLKVVNWWYQGFSFCISAPVTFEIYSFDLAVKFSKVYTLNLLILIF